MTSETCILGQTYANVFHHRHAEFIFHIGVIATLDFLGHSPILYFADKLRQTTTNCNKLTRNPTYNELITCSAFLGSITSFVFLWASLLDAFDLVSDSSECLHWCCQVLGGAIAQVAKLFYSELWLPAFRSVHPSPSSQSLHSKSLY